uniref:Uncharacterized protein n=1 Tax=Strigamia maritima TaxID=126957 RepID=T1IQA8_STRMM
MIPSHHNLFVRDPCIFKDNDLGCTRLIIITQKVSPSSEFSLVDKLFIVNMGVLSVIDNLQHTIVFAFSLFTVGTALLLPPVLNPLLSTVDTAVTTLLGTGSCTLNPNCTEFIRTGLADAIEVLHLLNYTANANSFGAPLDRITITLPPDFNITLPMSVQKKINSTARKDSILLKIDNIHNELTIDLNKATAEVLNIGNTLNNALNQVACASSSVPKLSGLFSGVLVFPPLNSIASCIPRSFSFSTNLTGRFTFIIQNFRINIVYVVNNGSRTIVDSAQFAEDNFETMVIKNKTCDGTPEFEM